MKSATTTASRPARRRRFPWLPLTAGAALLALLVLGLRPKAAPVETARAAFGQLQASVSEEGKTRIRQRYVVSSPVAGQVRRIPFKPGTPIPSGDWVVALIDPTPSSPLDTRNHSLALARRSAAAELLAKSLASRELADKELSRSQNLFSAGTLSRQDLEYSQQRQNSAAREVTSAEGALRLAGAELLETVPTPITNPVEVRAQVVGSVLHVFQESLRVVSQGTPLLEIGDPADLEVIIEMLSRDAASISPGARVELSQWGGPSPLEGQVRLIEPAAFTKISALGVEEQRANVVVDITSPLSARQSLGDNFRVEARVILWAQDRVLKTPTAALFRHGSDWAAYLVRDGVARLVRLKAGHSSGFETEILDGLREGDEVILYPGDRISDGQRVQPLKV